jgi:hypothetical protein
VTVALLVPGWAWVLVEGQASRESELLGLLALHGPEAMSAAQAGRIPPFPGWIETILGTVGIMRVGDLVVGSVITFKPFQLWMLPVLIVPMLLHRDGPVRWTLASLLAVVCLLMGITGWKSGDSAVPFMLLGPVAATLLGADAVRIGAAIRRSAALAIAAGLIAASMIAELLYRSLAPLG